MKKLHKVVTFAIVIAMLFGFDPFMHPVFADPALPLPRIPVCGDQDGSELPFIFSCPDFVPNIDVRTYQVPGTGAVDLLFDFVYRLASYNNELGYFKVDSSSGAIGNLRPGDPGYLTSAFQRAQVIFPSGSFPTTPDKTFQFTGGDILVFFIVQNNTLVNLLSQNPNNNSSQLPLAFFSIDSLNPDAIDHFVGFQSTVADFTQFGFEDLTGGGDLDYDDIVYNVNPTLKPLTGQIDLTPLSATPQVGQTHTLTATIRDQTGAPLPNLSVGFTVTGVNLATGSSTTNLQGNATFSYLGGNVGLDTIVASATIGGQTTVSNNAFVEWKSSSPGGQIDLSITKTFIRPIQVVEGANINNDDKIDLVLGKPTVVRVRPIINNNSNSDAAKNLLVSLDFQGNQQTMSTTINDVISNSNFYLDFILTPTTTGDSNILIKIDPTNLIAEQEEGNNQDSIAVTVKDTKGLYIYNMPVTHLGQLSEYDYTVQNAGEFTLGVYPVAPGEFTNLRGKNYEPPPASYLQSDKGVVVDLVNLWLQGELASLTAADVVVGVFPKEYAQYHGCNFVGVTLGPAVRSALVQEGHLTASAHEIGHIYGLGEGYTAERTGPCSATVISPGPSASGYWVARNEPKNTIGFMGTSPGLHSFDRWAATSDFVHLFKQFRKSPADPEVLLVSGLVLPDGSIELMPLYRLTEGVADEIATGDYSLQLLDTGGNLIQEFSFDVSTTLDLNPFVPLDLDLGAFAFVIPYPDEATTMRIMKNGSPVINTVLTSKLLSDAISALPDSAFTKDPDQRRRVLLSKVKEVEAKIQEGDIEGAVNKLKYDVRKQLENWLSDDYQPENVLQYSKADIIRLVDEMIERLILAK